MTVSLFEFFSSGQLGTIAVGTEQSSVRSAFGEPRATGGTSRKRRTPAIWQYGDVEIGFSFDDSPVVEYISLNRSHDDPNNVLQLDADVAFNACEIAFEMPLDDFLHALDGGKIDYHREEQFGEPVVVTSGGVTAFCSKDAKTSQLMVTKWIVPG